MGSWSTPISPLGRFFIGFFHQDWRDEYPDAATAVATYVDDESLDHRKAARQELLQLLARCDSESELSAAVDKLGSSYHPPGVGETYREWLEKVERYLRKHEV